MCAAGVLVMRKHTSMAMLDLEAVMKLSAVPRVKVVCKKVVQVLGTGSTCQHIFISLSWVLNDWKASCIERRIVLGYDSSVHGSTFSTHYTLLSEINK